MIGTPKFACVHLKRVPTAPDTPSAEDPARRDSSPRQSDWICACGVYDRRWCSNSRPSPDICFGPRQENCPEFEPNRSQPAAKPSPRE